MLQKVLPGCCIFSYLANFASARKRGLSFLTKRKSDGKFQYLKEEGSGGEVRRKIEDLSGFEWGGGCFGSEEGVSLTESDVMLLYHYSWIYNNVATQPERCGGKEGKFIFSIKSYY